MELRCGSVLIVAVLGCTACAPRHDPSNPMSVATAYLRAFYEADGSREQLEHGDFPEILRKCAWTDLPSAAAQPVKSYRAVFGISIGPDWFGSKYDGQPGVNEAIAAHSFEYEMLQIQPGVFENGPARMIIQRYVVEVERADGTMQKGWLALRPDLTGRSERPITGEVRWKVVPPER